MGEKPRLEKLQKDLAEMIDNSSWTQTKVAREVPGVGQSGISAFLKAPPDEVPRLVGRQGDAVEIIEGLIKEWRQKTSPVELRILPQQYDPEVGDPFTGIAMEFRALAEFFDDETVAPSIKFAEYKQCIASHVRSLKLVDRFAKLSIQPSAND